MATRRDFLRSATGAGLGGLWMERLLALSPASSAEAEVSPHIVRFDGAIEPIVRLIEETPRERCFDMAVEQLRAGLSYRHFLAALFLAGIRNVNPQPPGFKLHCVFVINAAHQLSLDAPVGQRLLPLFWALDAFKQSQAEDVAQGDFRLRPVSGTVPSPERAWEEFDAAMEAWDQERADRAIVALVRSRGAQEVISGLWKYGARDYRNIGHKAIFVANTWRTLETIGWQHAEPALRSLVLGLLDFGKDRTVNNYAFADQAYLPNAARAATALSSLPGDWTQREPNTGTTRALLDAVRQGDMEGSAALALRQLTQGEAKCGAVWDAAHLAAGELMMQQRGIYGIHTVTSVNALDYAFRTAADPGTRLMLLLQGLGWMCQFRNFIASRPEGLKPIRITELEPAEIANDPAAAASDVFATVSTDVDLAARKALEFAKQNPVPAAFGVAARQFVFTKGTDAHHYKYSAAILEDFSHVSPEWRPHLLATAVYYIPGSGTPDSPLMLRAAEAIGKV